MNNTSFGGGGKKRRNDFIGGRPKSDANYGPKKKSFDKKPGFRGGNDRPMRQNDRELFATTCTTCGKACEVPFRPDGSKPVLCRDCFAKNHPADRGDFKQQRDFGRGSDQNFRKPEQRSYATNPAPHDPAHFTSLTKQVATLETKLDEVLAILRTTKAETSKAAANESAITTETEDTTSPEPKEVATKKKAAVAKKVTAPKKAVSPKKVNKKAARKAA